MIPIFPEFINDPLRRFTRMQGEIDRTAPVSAESCHEYIVRFGFMHRQCVNIRKTDSPVIMPEKR